PPLSHTHKHTHTETHTHSVSPESPCPFRWEAKVTPAAHKSCGQRVPRSLWPSRHSPPTATFLWFVFLYSKYIKNTHTHTETHTHTHTHTHNKGMQKPGKHHQQPSWP